MGLLGKLKTMLHREPSVVDKAVAKCTLKGDETLIYQFLMFYESHRAAGANLTVAEDDLPYLDEVLAGAAELLDDPEATKTTYDGVAVYFGTVAAMALGGNWARAGDGTYAVNNLGANRLSVNPFELVHSVLDSSGTAALASRYAQIRKDSGG